MRMDDVFQVYYWEKGADHVKIRTPVLCWKISKDFFYSFSSGLNRFKYIKMD